ncbi:MAG: valine--tRNA ligase [Desulfobacteraceae bacterium]|jgi:valyl-tRNA synthetase|nr:valine--tRNA ligase [Desulfobacteraceae bacterium]
MSDNQHISLEKGYDPKNVEPRWYATWENAGAFSAADTSDRPPFSIVIPPPNVTGVLHMGHALNNTMQDILCRYRRLQGDNVLWMPGTDHAGIATQNVVERDLAAQGLDRHHLGREKFIEAVWQWRERYGSAIINQLKRLGASCDWQRERFTMDEGLSLAVRKVFVQLYEEGLIYRGQYIINWCPRCHTALADLEVEHEEVDGHLYHIRYPFPGRQDGIVIATTRPETMLGDTAVAVHPEDDRYSDLPAETVILPLMERELPIIRDSYVDREFGTGGLKVTPAHDPNDFELGSKHNLERIKVIGDDGRMTEAAGAYAGLDRFECRARIIDELKARGLLVKVTPLRHSVGHCYRCKTAVEPNLSLQWFVRAKPLAEPAIRAVEEGLTRIIPEAWAKTYYEWMYNIRDWCISRQIWWGHQIPAWTCRDCGKLTVAMEAPQACPQCGSQALDQETDVLDTWFSSALWPFSTMGWPEETDLLKTFYPTSVLVTGFDILFFWVARMMMMGLHFMHEVPFRDVYVHALVRDEDGKKMSKSKGNVIDPLTVIDEYGTDAFRFTLAAFAAQGRDIKLSLKRVEGYRNFINKLWNAARFSLMHLDRPYPRIEGETTLPQRWILSRLARVSQEVTAALDEYRFNEAAASVYNFLWHEFCDWFLEASKADLYNDADPVRQATARQVLWRVLHDALILLHPFIPFVTEEIWSHLPGAQGLLMQARWPTRDLEIEADPAVENDMGLVMGVITGIRNIRGEMNIAPGVSLAAQIQAPNPETRSLLEIQQPLISQLSRLKALTVSPPGARPRSAATAIVDGAAVYVSLEGVIDLDKETERLTKELTKVAKDMGSLSKKLNNEDFLAKAPAEVVEGVREKHAALADKQHKIEGTLERIRSWE